MIELDRGRPVLRVSYSPLNHDEYLSCSCARVVRRPYAGQHATFRQANGEVFVLPATARDGTMTVWHELDCPEVRNG